MSIDNLLDVNGDVLTADTQIASGGTVEWKRTEGKNRPFLRGSVNLLDYGARATGDAGARVSITESSADVTLASPEDASLFKVGDYVAVIGAGAAHGMSAPAQPLVELVAPPDATAGSTTRQYAIAWLSLDWGWSKACDPVTITGTPDPLGDPWTAAGQASANAGCWVRITPKYVDCRASEITNVTLSGLGSSDGITFTDGQLVLLLGQTNPADNGPWAKHSGAWTRPTGFASGSDLAQGMICRVQQGTLRTRTLYQLDTAGPYTLGTTALSFSINKAKIGVVWQRIGTSGTNNWEIIGGFLANSYLFGLKVQFNDMGFRPGTMPNFLLPYVTPPTSERSDLLRSRIASAIVSGDVTTGFVLDDPSGATITTGVRLSVDCTIPWLNAYADAVSRGVPIEIPEGEFQFWSDLKIEDQHVTIRGRGILSSTLLFAPGYAVTAGDNSNDGELENFRISMFSRVLPGGDMLSVPTEPNFAGDVDRSFHGAGLTLRSSDTVVRRVRCDNIYGSGFIVRASSSEGTNANRCSLEHCESEQNHGHGFQTGGSDANACLFLRCNAINCAGEGFNDSAFLGNTFVMCHVEGVARRAYSNRERGTASSVFVGCYGEAGSNRANRIVFPGVWFGGPAGNDFEPHATSDGIVIANRDRTSPIVVTTAPKTGFWTPGGTHEAGDYVRPTINNGFIYQAKYSGGAHHTGTTEPDWPDTEGNTVADGDVVWINTGLAPSRNLQLGEMSNENLLLQWTEDGNPRGLAHSAIYNAVGKDISFSFVGGQGVAMRWRGLGGLPTKQHAVGMLQFPSFVQVGGESSAHFRRFGWSFGEPDFPGIYSLGDTFIDVSGTGRVYKAATDFGIGTTWAASTHYAVGDVVYPNPPDGRAFTNVKAVSASNTAQSGSAQPSWPSGTNASIDDGECTWTRHGADTPQWTVSVEMADGPHLADADATITVSGGNKRTLLVPLTANRTIRLGASGATAGEIIHIVRIGLGAFTLTVKDDTNGTTLYVFPASHSRAADFRFDGTNFQGPLTGGGTHSAITEAS